MNFLFFNVFADRMEDGGPFFMYSLLIMLLTCIGLCVYGYLKREETNKMRNLVSHISLFALVWGFFSMMLGLISVFDAVSLVDSDSSQFIASGLKQGLLSPLFGMFVFLVARVGILILSLKK